MVKIQPVSIWKDGQEKQAEVLSLRIVADDMATSCTFYYELKEANQQEADGNEIHGQVLAVGNQSMGGADYTSWTGANADAYTYVAGKLKLIIM